MIDVALESPEPQYTHATIRRLVILGMSLVQLAALVLPVPSIPLLLVMSIGLSVLCGWLIPGPRRWWVGLCSLVSVLSVLSIDTQRAILSQGPRGWLWLGMTPLLTLALIQLYLTLSARAFTLPPATPTPSTDRLAHPRFGVGQRSFLTLLVLTLALHTLGLMVRWAYLELPCTWLDVTRRMQGCAPVSARPRFPSGTSQVHLSPTSARLASIANAEDVALPSFPLTEAKVAAHRQQLATQTTTISVWNIQDGTVLRTLEQPAGVEHITVSANDQWVATGGFDDQVRVWKVDDDTVRYTIPDDSLAALSADGSLLATTTTHTDAHVRLWSLRDGTLLRTISLPANDRPVEEMVFSPDGTVLALAELGEVTLWRVRDGARHATLTPDYFPNRSNPSIAFSPDGQVLATTGVWFGNDRDRLYPSVPVRLWRVKDGTPLHALSVDPLVAAGRLSAEHHAVYTLAFSPDSTRLVAGMRELDARSQAAVMWRVADGAMLEHIEPVVGTDTIRFRADGTALQIYDLSSDRLRMYTERISPFRSSSASVLRVPMEASFWVLR